jgi:hypothetical protein
MGRQQEEWEQEDDIHINEIWNYERDSLTQETSHAPVNIMYLYYTLKLAAEPNQYPLTESRPQKTHIGTVCDTIRHS